VATANPSFNLHHQAMSSLQRIHQICLALQGMQVIASSFVLTMGYITASKGISAGFQLYAALLYSFVAVFAHVVVYYVLVAVSQNVRSAHAANPSSVDAWLVGATRRLANGVLPFLVLHIAALLAVMVFASTAAASHSLHRGHNAVAWLTAGVGAACLVRVFYALRKNTGYLTAFLVAGGFSDFQEASIPDA
jgi:hypothetical protein